VTDRTYDSDGLDDDLKQDGVNETFSIDQGGCSSKCSEVTWRARPRQVEDNHMLRVPQKYGASIRAAAERKHQGAESSTL